VVGPQVPPSGEEAAQGKGEQYVENPEDAKKVCSYEKEHKNRETFNEHLERKIGDAS